MIKHGTYSAYANQRCRCLACVDAARSYKRQWHAENPRRPVTRTCCHPDGCPKPAMRENGDKSAWCSMHYTRIRDTGEPGPARSYTNHRRGWSKTEQIRFRTYGITPEDWNALFLAQGERCASCGSTDPRSIRGWHTDHDHDSDAVLGILCHKCNIKIHGDTTEQELVDLLAYYRRTRRQVRLAV